METKKNSSHKIDPEQRELIERAQSRARKKRRLYLHFIFFLIVSVILILVNLVFELGRDIRPLGVDWWGWIIGIWALILLFHVFHVFVTDKFFGKDWEKRQVEMLVEKQNRRIEELQKKVEKEKPLQPSKSFPKKNPPFDIDSHLNS